MNAYGAAAAASALTITLTAHGLCLWHHVGLGAFTAGALSLVLALALHAALLPEEKKR